MSLNKGQPLAKIDREQTKLLEYTKYLSTCALRLEVGQLPVKVDPLVLLLRYCCPEFYKLHLNLELVSKKKQVLRCQHRSVASHPFSKL